MRVGDYFAGIKKLRPDGSIEDAFGNPIKQKTIPEIEKEIEKLESEVEALNKISMVLNTSMVKSKSGPMGGAKEANAAAIKEKDDQIEKLKAEIVRLKTLEELKSLRT
ncbi:MAG: hypothetical protein FWD15_02850 [Alphaproteobacteria bacterium]|nr:hypothetical protein [Alphaproteobacteria bacterium]